MLAGHDEDADVRIVSYPGSSLMDLPAAQAVVTACGGVAAGGASACTARPLGDGILSQAERSLTGVTALWLGDYRF